ncbi:MAG: AI-2E family transporter [Gemmatimonadota bacterium]
MSDTGEAQAAVPRQAERAGKIVLLVLAIAITLLFLAMIRSFVVALLLAAVFSAMTRPIYLWLGRKLGARHRTAAVATILLVVLLLILPLGLFLGIVVAQAVSVSEAVGPWIERQLATPHLFDSLMERVPQLEWLAPYQDAIVARAGQIAGSMGTFLVNSVAALTRSTAAFLLDLFIMLYAMFFFLIKGQEILARILYYLPLAPDDEGRMIEKFVSVTRATIKGSLVIGVIQGGLAGLGFAVAGVPASAFWGTVMAVLSIIPAVGSGFVWVPAVIWMFASGQTGAAIGLGLWCLVVVGGVDNFLRPWLVGRDTKMSDLLVLISTLGGLFLFGAVGFILGPIVAALFVTIWDIYGRVFREYLPDGPPEPIVEGP